MPKLSFESRLESDQGACFIPLPAEVLTALGREKRVPVRVTIDGYTYRTTIAVYGGNSYLGVRREVRKAAGVAAGEPLVVGLEYDAELRTADLPNPLRAALDADPAAAAVFQRLSDKRQKEVVDWVKGACDPTLRRGGSSRRWRCWAPARQGADASGGLTLPQRIGDPVVEHPLFLEGEDGQEQLFVYIFQVLPAADTFCVERLRNERLDRLGSIHSCVTFLLASVVFLQY